MGGTLDEYLNHLQTEGPPAKAFQLKASGAEQDDEEPPTDERTKRFERDEARVGVKEFGANAQIASTPSANLDSPVKSGGYADVIAHQIRKLKKHKKR